MLLSLLSRRTLEAESRDAYGFSVRPQHLQRYSEYTDIYKAEEEERSDKWGAFLKQHRRFSKSSTFQEPKKSVDIEDNDKLFHASSTENGGTVIDTSNGDGSFYTHRDIVFVESKDKRVDDYACLNSSLGLIETMMSFRVKARKCPTGSKISGEENFPASTANFTSHMADDMRGVEFSTSESLKCNLLTPISFPWKHLEFLVHGGIPRALRGEVWQAFVGVGKRRIEGYYLNLLRPQNSAANIIESNNSPSPNDLTHLSDDERLGIPEKWRKQIEKDLPRTFPGHPALNEWGKNSLRRLLFAYARHNPIVGYCQAMNFFAGLLLLMMPEENAFWTLLGIIDDYFDGYYSEEMTESQVDLLVFEELMHERFPKLAEHLQYLGVEVAWLCGSWFLSIFVNVLPWESVLRVWDVLLFEGNRVMLFRTALALLDLYGAALMTAQDAGDAMTLFQSLIGSTFESSRLIVTAYDGFLAITDNRLATLREKHRPSVVAANTRETGVQVPKDPKGLASKLYSFKHDQSTLSSESKIPNLEMQSVAHDGLFQLMSATEDVDSVPDLQEQVVWLKVELCKLLQENKSASLRSDELETALMEMVRQDTRRQLSTKVEQLEREIGELRQALGDKQEQVGALLEVIMRLEQEQRITEDARMATEHSAASQRSTIRLLQDNYNQAISSLSDMERRAVLAESMLEATVQYNSGQLKATVQFPVTANPAPPPPRKPGILSIPFGLGWRDRTKSSSPPPAADTDHDNGSTTQQVAVNNALPKY